MQKPKSENRQRLAENATGGIVEGQDWAAAHLNATHRSHAQKQCRNTSLKKPPTKAIVPMPSLIYMGIIAEETNNRST